MAQTPLELAIAEAARTGEPITIERADYHITIWVRRLEEWEKGEPDPVEPFQHPLAIPGRHGRRVPTT